MRMRGPRGHDGTGRKLRLSHADKRSDKTAYKQSNKKYFHENDGVVVFIGVEFRKTLVDLSSLTLE